MVPCALARGMQVNIRGSPVGMAQLAAEPSCPSNSNLQDAAREELSEEGHVVGVR